jgi:hypothetical protein
MYGMRRCLDSRCAKNNRWFRKRNKNRNVQDGLISTGYECTQKDLKYIKERQKKCVHYAAKNGTIYCILLVKVKERYSNKKEIGRRKYRSIVYNSNKTITRKWKSHPKRGAPGGRSVKGPRPKGGSRV